MDQIILKETSPNLELYEWINFEHLGASEGVKQVYNFDAFPSVPKTIELLRRLGSLETIQIVPAFFPVDNWSSVFWRLCYEFEESEKDAKKVSKEKLDPHSIAFWDMLNRSSVDLSYGGYCGCLDFSAFLSIILTGLAQGEVTYCPRFISEDGEKLLFVHASSDIVIWNKLK